MKLPGYYSSGCLLYTSGTFVAYMYTLIMIVYYSREPGSRTGVADMVLWSTWGMTLQMLSLIHIL